MPCGHTRDHLCWVTGIKPWCGACRLEKQQEMTGLRDAKHDPTMCPCGDCAKIREDVLADIRAKRQEGTTVSDDMLSNNTPFSRAMAAERLKRTEETMATKVIGKKDLKDAINCASIDNDCDTPDHELAEKLWPFLPEDDRPVDPCVRRIVEAHGSTTTDPIRRLVCRVCSYPVEVCAAESPDCTGALARDKVAEWKGCESRS